MRTVQIVLQATPFCNIDCSYCYLPSRSDKSLMSEDVLRASFRFLRDSGLLRHSIDLRWHAGEPLVAGPGFYWKACELAATILPDGVGVNHSLQTNGMLLNGEWCKLFAAHRFRVGVSIDGPEGIHNSRRVTRSGAGTFRQTLDGIRCLQSHGIPFETISVVTPETLDAAEEFLAFMAALRPSSLGINVEETEGSHVSLAFRRTDFVARFRRFVVRLAEWEAATGIPVRELTHMRQIVLGRDLFAGNPQNTPFGILTIDVRGNVYTFSPELAGLKTREHPTFAIGNILTGSLAGLQEHPLLARLLGEISAGVEECRRTCAYFQICGGGAPANKLYENGAFSTAETTACRCTVMAVADVALEQLERAGRGRDARA